MGNPTLHFRTMKRNDYKKKSPLINRIKKLLDTLGWQGTLLTGNEEVTALTWPWVSRRGTAASISHPCWDPSSEGIIGKEHDRVR